MEFLIRHKEFDGYQVSYRAPGGDGEHSSGSLSTALLEMFRSSSDGSSILGVPTGADAVLARLLRGSGLFSYVNVEKGICDPGDPGYFVVDRNLFYTDGKMSETKLQTYLDERLKLFAKQAIGKRSANWRIAEQRLSRSGIPPYDPIYRARMYVASELTRGQPSMWDSFGVFFAPAEIPSIRRHEYAVITTVDRLKTVRRSGGNDSPPDDSYFKQELSASDEATVTNKLTSFFALRDKGWCVDPEESAEGMSRWCKNVPQD